MIFGYLDDPHRDLVFSGSLWKEVWEWIEQESQQVENGVYRLRGKDLYVNVEGYTTIPAEEARFESHRKYVDVQFMIEGKEYIEYHPCATLPMSGEYDGEKDLLFHEPAEPKARLPMTPGAFAVFFPEDAHRPKVQMGTPAPLRKLVVKIALPLLRGDS